ncbi:unnamed protein product [Rotaria sp. Silwood1]|nr:unnamed protein product [Rotaria sp. Silwood1]
MVDTDLIHLLSSLIDKTHCGSTLASIVHNSGRDRVRRGGFGGHLRRVGRGCARGGSGEVGGISNGNNIQTRRATC